MGPGGEVYVTWSAPKPKPEGVLFASDLYLSRSLDGGRTFEPPLRVNDDRPISHSFEDLAVTPDGTVLVGWIDSRDGARQTATYVARVIERGSRLERVDQARGRRDVRVLSRERGGRPRRAAPPCCGARCSPATCATWSSRARATAGAPSTPPRPSTPTAGRSRPARTAAGQVATDARGRLYTVWYTEGAGDRPDVLFAAAPDGRRFGAPRRVHTASGSVPDQPRLAVDPTGRGVVVWEDSTAVRRRILLRSIGEGGRSLGPVRTLSQAIKAWAPAVTAAPGGFLVAWHEEQFPATKTIVLRVGAEEGAR